MIGTAERVVLLDEHGGASGVAEKATVHDERTPLHLAFSCHVRDERGRLLITRRALAKRTWPGTWTNAFCGHPEPFEAIPDAVVRRADEELGLALGEMRLELPRFRYRAVDASGIVENEICPVYIAEATGTPVPNHDEVMDMRWVDPADLATALAAAPWAFSPWLVLQAQELAATNGVSIPEAWDGGRV